MVEVTGELRWRRKWYQRKSAKWATAWKTPHKTHGSTYTLAGMQSHLQSTISWPQAMKTDKLCISILINLYSQTWSMKQFHYKWEEYLSNSKINKEVAIVHSVDTCDCVCHIHDKHKPLLFTQNKGEHVWLAIHQVLNLEWENTGPNNKETSQSKMIHGNQMVHRGNMWWDKE